MKKAEKFRLSTYRYITENHHIILKGTSGSGKSYISNALGIAACRKFITVKYVRIPDLITRTGRCPLRWHVPEGNQVVSEGEASGSWWIPFYIVNQWAGQLYSGDYRASYRSWLNYILHSIRTRRLAYTNWHRSVWALVRCYRWPDSS